MTTKHKRLAITAGLVALTALVGWFLYPVLTVLVFTLFTLTGGYGYWRRRRAGSAALVQRWTGSAKKHHGVAHFWAILRHASWWTLRRRARVLKPSLRSQSWSARWRGVHITHLGTRIIKSGRLWVMSSVEEHTLLLGAPRMGKSGKQASTILDAPGAVLATSTGGDLISNTAESRSRIGPVGVFNPANIGGIASTINFLVLAGCDNTQTATERAADLLAGTPLSQARKDAEWVERATEALSVLMHAAVLGRKSMHTVQRWVADPDTAAQEVLGYLRASPDATVGHQALQFFNLGRPRSSVCMTIAPALRWLSDEAAEWHGAPVPWGAGVFDVASFLAERGTIYLLAEKDSPITPLITALAGYITREARRIADREPGERLRDAFTIALDEAPAIGGLPLPAWSSDMGKRSITMHICGQSLSQFEDRWGAKPAGALLTNCATKMVFGGTSDEDGLRLFSKLSGGLLTEAQIQQLPKFHALVFRNGLLPIVGRVQMVWERADHKAAARNAIWQPRIAKLGALCRAPFRRALAARAPVREPIAALPAAGTADREFADLLQEHGLR